MKIHLLTAEHFNVPGLVTKAFANNAQAVAEAVDLTNIMLKDNGWQPLASPVQWEHHISRLQDVHGARDCYIEITELDVADPVRDAVETPTEDEPEQAEPAYMTISDELRSVSSWDIFTDAPECEDSVSECHATMEIAANVMDELRKSLKDLLDHVTDSSAYEDAENGEDPELMAAVQAAEAAIAKAEGGAAQTTLVTAQSLEAKYGRWQDHPDYSDRDWRNDETRLGYWEWVASKVNGQEGGAA